jgi:hypothetical protein
MNVFELNICLEIAMGQWCVMKIDRLEVLDFLVILDFFTVRFIPPYRIRSLTIKFEQKLNKALEISMEKSLSRNEKKVLTQESGIGSGKNK